ncbi:prolyl oligopeptidase family serine peptidase [Ferroplasma sp.]|uniref:prolyl oligopeptidase family serine peptidase n=1 Tax=Ferroplasma sp. TaxID=2591003 RepID=UPI00307D5C2F
MRNAVSIPVLYDFKGNKLKEYNFNIPYGLISLDSDGDNAIIVMGSFGVPYSIFSYKNKEIKLIDRNIVSNPKVSDHYKDLDFGRVHYFFIEANKKTDNTLVYGYGGFNISITPSYNNLFAYLINNGVNVVICNLPGGGEYGEEWHRLGMRENKKNVFSAFQAIIKGLKTQGKQIICYGVSNGGLLSAYTLTKIPDELSGAVIGNPVTDLMRFHRLLAGQYWVSEYGDPDNPDDAKFLTRYSAYENLKPGKEPPALIYSRIDDDRVHPAHALKFYKKLKDFGSDPYLLIGTGGHLGSGMNDILEETVYIAAFIFQVFGIVK